MKGLKVQIYMCTEKPAKFATFKAIIEKPQMIAQLDRDAAPRGNQPNQMLVEFGKFMHGSLLKSDSKRVHAERSGRFQSVLVDLGREHALSIERTPGRGCGNDPVYKVLRISSSPAEMVARRSPTEKPKPANQHDLRPGQVVRSLAVALRIPEIREILFNAVNSGLPKI
ncbi:Uncharacterised protein [uncultured archaeon]|nr:Uncharacterised protein [uncultured archaeon]